MRLYGKGQLTQQIVVWPLRIHNRDVLPVECVATTRLLRAFSFGEVTSLHTKDPTFMSAQVGDTYSEEAVDDIWDF
jgi:hypothetical protein